MLQAEERVHAAVQPQEGAIPEGRLLLEEEEGRQDHPGGSHEAQGPRHRGQSCFCLSFPCVPKGPHHQPNFNFVNTQKDNFLQGMFM